jgi:DNA (cytosine-5)-methyltransferase 1
MNYYNEFDKDMALWIKQLIKEKLIPYGDVDTRDIKEVEPNDIKNYTQCHFFAGIAGWPLALKLAQWPEDKEVWTGSCPCQPFSSAGKQKGNLDERHLWPEFMRLIKQCKPKRIFGEQVERAIKFNWLDGISSDLETENYSVGSIVFGAHSVGSPHIRKRLYWLAHSKYNGCNQSKETTSKQNQDREDGRIYSRSVGRMGDTIIERLEGHSGNVNEINKQRRNEEKQNRSTSKTSCDMWKDSTTIKCGDGKTRRIKSSIAPLVNGISKRMVQSSNRITTIDYDNCQNNRQLRITGYGNAIVPQCASEFIKIYLEMINEHIYN